MASLLRCCASSSSSVSTSLGCRSHRNLLVPAGGGPTPPSFFVRRRRPFSSCSTTAHDSTGPGGVVLATRKSGEKLKDALNASPEKLTTRQKFEKWCKFHGKSYSSEKEEALRLKSFEKVLASVRLPSKFVCRVVNHLADEKYSGPPPPTGSTGTTPEGRTRKYRPFPSVRRELAEEEEEEVTSTQPN